MLGFLEHKTPDFYTGKCNNDKMQTRDGDKQTIKKPADGEGNSLSADCFVVVEE